MASTISMWQVILYNFHLRWTSHLNSYSMVHSQWTNGNSTCFCLTIHKTTSAMWKQLRLLKWAEIELAAFWHLITKAKSFSLASTHTNGVTHLSLMIKWIMINSVWSLIIATGCKTLNGFKVSLLLLTKSMKCKLLLQLFSQMILSMRSICKP